MDGREQRGIQIAATKKLRQKGDLWIVPATTGTGSYVVDPNPTEPTCSCPDFETWHNKCKHVYAVEVTMRCETTTVDGTVSETVRVTYRQEWSAYNAAQTNEKEHVAALLHDLCSAIENPVYQRGRPRLPLSDLVFCAVMKVYGGDSGRRTMSDLREFAAKGHIDKAPHYNSVFNAFENPALTPILSNLIEESAGPLKTFETDLAVDSTGFSVSDHFRWFSEKYGREISSTRWLKAHVCVGTLTNVVTSARITDRTEHDIHSFRPLLERTTRRFSPKRVSADKAYSAARIYNMVDAAGAQAFIPFKTNAKGTSPDTFHPGKELWSKMYGFFMFERQKFLAHYHKRSNVETTFSMIKAKFGSSLRSKTAVAQVNEVLCKILCHNLCVLVQSMYEMNVEPTFWQAS
jgi:transposase